MFFAGVGDHLATVAFGDHDEACAMVLEFVDVGIHTVGCCGAHAATRVSGRCFCGAGVEDWVFLEVFGHGLTSVESGFEFGVCNVACYDDGAVEAYSGAYGVFGEFGAYGVDAVVEVDYDAFSALAWFA